MTRLSFLGLLIFMTSCSPKTVRQLLDNGFQEDGEKAIRLYSRAISKDKNNIEGYWRRGDEYYKIKQYDKAIDDLNKAIHIDSTFNNGYLFGDRGNLKEAIGDYSGAIQDYTAALQFCKTTEPSTPRENFYFYRGRTKLKFRDTASATIDTDSAIYYWSSFPRARYQRAKLEVIKGEYKRASDDYNVFQLTPDMADDKEFSEDVFYLGVLKFKTGDRTYCRYWAAAAKNNYKIAVEYMLTYCKIE